MKALTLYLFSGSVFAQTLPTVNHDGPTWTILLILVGALIVVVGFVAYKTGHVGTGLQEVADAIKAHLTVAKAPGVVDATPVTVENTPPAPAGRAGVAGTFTVTVTGDPKVDIPALTKQYLGD